MLHRIISRRKMSAVTRHLREMAGELNEQECPELHHAKTRLEALERKVEVRTRPWPTATEAIVGRRLS